VGRRIRDGFSLDDVVSATRALGLSPVVAQADLGIVTVAEVLDAMSRLNLVPGGLPSDLLVEELRRRIVGDTDQVDTA
jgi:hypothetical protein